MGRAHRYRPRGLGKKLLLIRNHLGLTQPELIELLAIKGQKLYPSTISLFEKGDREPSLLVLLRYSRLVKIPMETLADDKIRLRHKDLP